MDININIENEIANVIIDGVTYVPEGEPVEPSVQSGFLSRCSVYSIADQAIPDNPQPKIKVVMEGVDYDDNNEFANGRFTPKEAGYYTFSYGVGMLALIADKSVDAFLYKNSEKHTKIGCSVPTQVNPHTGKGRDIYLNVGDYVEVFVWHNSGVVRYVDGDKDVTYLTIHRFA